MVPREGLDFTWSEAIRLIENHVPGWLVECGTWKGGCSFGMLLAQKAAFGEVRRSVWMFDSFQGLPPVTERDGPLAAQYQRDTGSPAYFDNCKAELAEVKALAARLGLSPKDYQLAPGWFHETVPDLRPVVASQNVALLRVDCDWYDPVSYALSEFVPSVSEEGLVILDDYYTWDGCARATHDYLSRNDLCYRIKSLPGFSGACFTKRKERVSHQQL